MALALMNAGRAKLAQAFNASIKPVVNSFEIGSNANFTPNPGSTGVLPSVSYSGGISNILKTIVSENELILSIYLPYTLALSNIGNLMLRFNDGTPFLWLVLPTAVSKAALNNDKHFAGDMHFKSMILKFPNISNLLDLSNNPNLYAQAGVADTLDLLPDAVSATSTEYFVGSTDHYFNQNSPTFAFNVGNKWWGIPNMKELTSGTGLITIDGGVAGDNYGRPI